MDTSQRWPVALRKMFQRWPVALRKFAQLSSLGMSPRWPAALRKTCNSFNSYQNQHDVYDSEMNVAWKKIATYLPKSAWWPRRKTYNSFNCYQNQHAGKIRRKKSQGSRQRTGWVERFHWKHCLWSFMHFWGSPHLPSYLPAAHGEAWKKSSVISDQNSQLQRTVILHMGFQQPTLKSMQFQWHKIVSNTLISLSPKYCHMGHAISVA